VILSLFSVTPTLIFKKIISPMTLYMIALTKHLLFKIFHEKESEKQKRFIHFSTDAISLKTA